jgi:hypothetical protein
MGAIDTDPVNPARGEVAVIPPPPTTFEEEVVVINAMAIVASLSAIATALADTAAA